jgi:pimeloyl-ACP methyl ester carboxylesterase
MRSVLVASSILLFLTSNIAGSVVGRDSRGLQKYPDRAGSSAVETARLTAPQQRIEIEQGRHLNLLCLGSGTPTVLFESGTGGATYDWRYVQAAVAEKTTACAYDRAGFGFSDPARRTSDANHAADDLQQLVLRAHLQLPLILVGHSNGGIYAVRFAQLYKSEVAGMVLVDPGFTGQQDFSAYGLPREKAEELEAENAEWIRSARSCAILANQGALNGVASSPCLDDPPNPNDALHRALNLMQSRPAYTQALLSEFESTFQKVGGTTVNDSEVPLPPKGLGNLPVTVLTASRHPARPADFTGEDQAKYYAFWKTGHDRLAALSTCGRNVVVPDSGHFIQYDQPQTVIFYILGIVTQSHASRPNTCGADE